MILKDFQYLNTLDSGSTTYEQNLITYFKIDTNQSITKVQSDLQKCLEIKPYEIKKNYIKLKGKRYFIEKNFLDCSYEQFSRLEMILSENKNVENIHKLLSIFIRPYKYFIFKSKYNIKEQDDIYNALLELDMDMAQSILLFFYQNVLKSLNNINIHYLNQVKMVVKNQFIKNK